MSTVFFGLIIVVAVISAVFMLLKFKRSANWASIEGSILESTIEKIQGSRTQGTTDYRINIRYQYTVEGREYTGNRVVAGLPNIAGSRSDREDTIRKYPAGSAAIIHFDPGAPADSALVVGKSLSTAGFIAIAGLLLVVGGIMFGLLYVMEHLD